jgi:dienelactone hydrolase
VPIKSQPCFATLAKCLFLGLAATVIAGCQTATQRALAYARDNGLRPALVTGKAYVHETFESLTPDRRELLVLIEGDGVPWDFRGTRIALDPTPKRPLMLMVAARSQMSTLYVGRPCYFEARVSPACEPSVWTSARYSQRVVESIASVVNAYVQQYGFERVLLAGHSGGGTLAVLVAPRVPKAAVVVTLAANLDIDAWTRKHRYLPLSGSLNPADQPKLPTSVQEWHAVGEKDENVPPAINEKYWQRVGPEKVWRFPKADHGCCWLEEWPGIVARARAAP